MGLVVSKKVLDVSVQSKKWHVSRSNNINFFLFETTIQHQYNY